MSPRRLRRATALSMILLLAVTGTASADSVLADGDALTPSIEGTVHLGDVAPGSEVTTSVRFVLTCGGLGHVDPGQSVVLTSGGGTQPADGVIVSAGSARVGPVPSGWIADGEGCPSPAPTLAGGSPVTVVLRAPTTPADGYLFTITWDRSLDPEGSDDGAAFGRTPTTVSFTLDVLADLPPSIAVPGDHAVEGDTTGGWTAGWAAVTASDPEDDPDPLPSCDPAAGVVLPLGATTVTCTVTDSAGGVDAASFEVTVVDTTPPTLVGRPSDHVLTTTDPAGATLAYTPPTTTDVVDPSPAVACSPAPGTAVGLGATEVACTATDASGNAATERFTVTVVHATPVTATWFDPIGDAERLVANRGRVLPVKVRLAVDGEPVTTGAVTLRIEPCAGGQPVDLTLDPTAGRWQVNLDTGPLASECSTLTVLVDGVPAGTMTLELLGTDGSRARAGRH